MPLMESGVLDQIEGAEAPRHARRNVLLERARALSPKDRLILELTFRKNLSVRELAPIFGQPAGTVSRRIQRLCARLRDPMVLALIDPACPLSPEFRQLAIEHFAQDQTIRELSQAHQITKDRVKKILAFVRGWYRGIHQSPRRIV